MKDSNKTNPLAIVSFASGIIALIFIVLVFVLYTVVDTSEGVIKFTDGLIMPARNLLLIISLLTGILALNDIKKSGGTQKSKILSWFGIVTSAGWLFLGILVGVTFLLAELSH